MYFHPTFNILNQMTSNNSQTETGDGAQIVDIEDDIEKSDIDEEAVEFSDFYIGIVIVISSYYKENVIDQEQRKWDMLRWFYFEYGRFPTQGELLYITNHRRTKDYSENITKVSEKLETLDCKTLFRADEQSDLSSLQFTDFYIGAFTYISSLHYENSLDKNKFISHLLCWSYLENEKTLTPSELKYIKEHERTQNYMKIVDDNKTKLNRTLNIAKELSKADREVNAELQEREYYLNKVAEALKSVPEEESASVDVSADVAIDDKTAATEDSEQ